MERNPLADVVITKPPKARAVIRGAGNQADEAAAREIMIFDAVTKTDNENSAPVMITKISADPMITKINPVITKIGRGRPAKGERPMTAYERLKAYRLRKRAAS